MTGALRISLRRLARAPAFAATAILTFALGIGASALIFTVVDAVLLEPLPYPEPDEIVRLHEVNEQGSRPNLSDPNFYDLKTQSRSLEALAHFELTVESILGGDAAARGGLAIVSSEFTRVLGVTPVHGRDFVAEEQQLGGPPAVLVSYGYWRGYLGGEAFWREESEGRALTIGDLIYDVVGVMPPGFDYPEGAEAWVSREALYPSNPSRTAHNLRTLGRLAPGVSIDAARAELRGIAARLKALHGGDTDMVDVSVVTLRELLVGSVRPALVVLAAGAALLLLVASANVTSLVLARGVVRGRELSVRVALGAGRARLARQYFCEMLVLTIGACGIGLLLAGWGIDVLHTLQPGVIPRAEGISLDGEAVLFAGGLAILLAGALGGIVASRAWSGNVFGSANRRSATRDHRSHWSDGLVAVQIAIALVLVVGALLLGRTLLYVAAVDPGFRLENGLLINVATPRAVDPESQATIARYYDEVLGRLAAIPGVDDVGAVTVLPLDGGYGDGSFVTLRDPAEEIADFAAWDAIHADRSRRGNAEYRLASAGYFSAVGIPLLRGRAFDARDVSGAPHVGLVSQSLAEAQWPGEDPIGKSISFPSMDGDFSPITIVGVVADVREYGLDRPVRPTFYAHYLQRPGYLGVFWIMLYAEDREAVIPVARSIVRELSPQWPPEFRFSEDLFSAAIGERRFNLAMLGVFGGTALLLALAGVFGAMTFQVAQRIHEIGVRMALGAAAGSVVAMVVRRGLWIAGAGVLAGLLASLVVSRLIESLLFGIAPHDPASYVIAAAALIALAGGASWCAARKAARVDPIIALRPE